MKSSLIAGAGLMLPLRWNLGSVFASGSSLQPFVDPLPLPGVLQPQFGVAPGAAYYEIGMSQFTQKLHRDLDPTLLWGYNGTYPGPTIEAKVGQRAVVKWINNLPTTHLLPIDYTLHGAQPPSPDVRNVVHLHGGHVPPESDGFPEDWFTPGDSATYDYPNRQRPTMLWYHDHALGITRLNVYAGLAGLWFLRDSFERTLPIPKGEFEIPLVIQDRSFNSDGSLFYPDKGITHPVWVPEFFGDTILVNGKVWPYLDVEPRKYRFRILNGSQARFYRISLSSDQPFYQIGTEGGLLTRPIMVNHILLAPAERVDVIVDFSRHAGDVITMTNNAAAPYPSGDPVDPNTTGQVIQFRVNKRLSSQDIRGLPQVLSPVTALLPQSAVKVRNLALQEVVDDNGNPMMLMLNAMMWDDPITEKPKLGTTEIWRFINTTMDTHPMHLHLVQFQVLDRQPFNVELYKATGILKLRGLPMKPPAEEAGWKDTVRANPGEVTRIIARFEDYTGKYVWHCHILEHEDNDMMRPFEVVA
jgi:spore coat protein A